ncbi:hypothetical protein [Massilia sp. BHUDP2]|uniref:hypothetical protein n=1 Tax=Massilia sp. BHUDP2 TaxID=3034505 RepID=UPI0039062434
MANLYGLVLSVQEALITRHCFGDCGQVSLGGALMTEDLGPLFVCGEEVCPYLKGQTDEPIGTSQMTGEPIFIRAIRDERAADAAETRDEKGGEQ